MNELTKVFSVSLLPLLAVAATDALLEYLLPGGKDARMASSLRLVTGLCVLLALAAPLREAAGLLSSLSDGGGWASMLSGGDVTPGEDYLGQYLSGQSADAVAAWAKAELNDRFGIPPDLCRVVVTMSADGTSVQRVDVVLTGQARLTNPHLIEEHFARETGGECRVTVE